MKIQCFDIYGKVYEFEESQFVHRPAVYGVLQKNDELLVVQERWNHTWGLPGGGIENGESDSRALIREFGEETGILISSKMTELFSDYSYFKPEGEDRPWKTYRCVYAVSAIGGELRKIVNGEEVDKADFLPLIELQKLVSEQGSNDLIAKVLSYVTK